ncbi:FCS-Like Zinc finger 10 isoform X1 [Lotus japonicus]|uniref:FCS-Like Zinc finger 10 isoform X1 n=1 Tax=Lotus japonicus TaxID=34305 RepID=UPI0025902C39|nr:FCS-Like Zinc finger 10 isoform X1 [Lotus japonicus]XP_057456827.1 FCS-Like Zinc finger 10 isoform X1 [Lotus japonicus]
MADSSSNFSLSLIRQRSFSIFHSSGSRIGIAAAKGSPDSESVWSPTSPLDFKLLNLSNPFSANSSKPFQTGHKKNLDCRKIGLGIVSSLVNETKLSSETHGDSKRGTIIFGPQVKKTSLLKFSKNNHESIASDLKSNSLPKNYVVSLPSETKSPKSEEESFDDINWDSEGFRTTVTSLPDSSRSSPLKNLNSRNNDFFEENTASAISLPSPLNNSLKNISSSLPITIDFSKGHIGSLSAKEIELSEDYTCIISHGPNPKRTHIFGDCILECHNNDFTEFSKKEETAFRSSGPSFSAGSAPLPFDNVLSFCYSCNKKLDEGEDIDMFRGKKAFCCFKCRSEEILVEEEMEKNCSNSVESSPESSYHDLFLKGLFVSK